MPHLDHKGPEGLGSKTGRKLGKCKKNEEEQIDVEKLGIGQGLRRKSGGGIGKKEKIKIQYKNLTSLLRGRQLIILK